jgi:tetratricopeptide (TPR) repeat protein
VRMEPRDPRSWAGVAQLCATDWRDARAEETALHAIALNGAERFAHQSLGVAYALRGRLEEARREMETELRITGPNANTFLALAAIESRAGRPASSKSWLEKARSLDGGLVAKFERRLESFLPDARPIRTEATSEN